MARKPAAPKKAKAADPVPVDALTHVADTRPNIPTRETAAFAPDDVRAAVYRRDPSLDPQLVWKGKDAPGDADLSVPAVPIYVQEKVHPRAIVERVRSWGRAAAPADNLFADFNGLDDFAKKLDFYQHSQHWTNRLILGDSLLVMASLAERERLRGKVQCVYFDPPYGIKFGSNWQVSTRKRDVKDAKADDLTRQPEQVKAFRDTWELGVHSYLTYLRDRLAAARDLLTESGSCFVQIGDENVHLVRCLMDEVFGSENFCGQIQFKKTGGQSSSVLPSIADYLLWYANSRNSVKYRQLFEEKVPGQEGATNYTWIEEADGTRRALSAAEVASWNLPDNCKVFQPYPLFSEGPSEHDKPFEWNGQRFEPSRGSHWKTTADGLKRLAVLNRLLAQGKTLRFINYLEDYPVTPSTNLWTDTQISGYGESKVYVVQTLSKVIQRCLLMTTDPGDLVLDPTCGSGTTAFVAEQWGRRWITVDTSRVALALARTRLMAAKYPYYLLADSPEGRKKQAEVAGTPAPANAPPAKRDVHAGFVYKTVPHVTLKSIANNPDIREGMTREEIDAAIRKHAETETLFDQPYEDKGTVRVTGPFTVESLSPHRELPPVTGIEPSTPAPTRLDAGNYVQTIVANLLKTGVKGTTKDQRIGFPRLDPFPGHYVHAEGVTDADLGVRVSVGPELGTVGDDWIKHAALEAIKGSRCDLLLVCAFAFEAGVHEQTAELTKEIRFGKLRILPVRMNPDLAMFGDQTGQELLKKTGAGNLFTVFGEPDLRVTRTKDRQVVVEVRGVDVFDPATGEVRSGGTDDVACWFVDTDYDGQSFFVRHAYFCGAENPYEKLKKALRAEVDEAEWGKLYATASQPFPPPASGRIAVKVINHFGDEVLKVVPVA